MLLLDSLTSIGRVWLGGIVVAAIVSGLDRSKFIAPVSIAIIIGVSLTVFHTQDLLIIPGVALFLVLFLSLNSKVFILGVALITIGASHITMRSIRDGITELTHEWFVVCLVIIIIEFVTHFITMRIRRKKLKFV